MSDWVLPLKTNKAGAVTKWRKRPFIRNLPPAASETVHALAEDGSTWQEIHDQAIYDPDVRAIATGFIDAGFGDHRAAPMLVTWTADPADQIVGLTPGQFAALLDGRMPTDWVPEAERTIRLTLRDLAEILTTGEATVEKPGEKPPHSTLAAGDGQLELALEPDHD